MKFLFDFDGVLTDQTGEALRVSRIFEAELRAKAGLEDHQVTALLKQAHDELQHVPHLHGWKTNGRIAAYANEDYFMQNVGLSLCLDEMADAGLALPHAARQGLNQQGYKRFFDVSQHGYVTMIAQTSLSKHKPLDPQTKPVIEALLNRGGKIVVVSNSSTERILNMLATLDLPAVDHETHPQADLRVRGSAKKFDLAVEKQGYFIGGYWIDTARPHFIKIITEEKPQVVVGDVFSLDLATPCYLAQTRPDFFGEMTIVLREREYTPNWSKEFMRGQSAGNMQMKIIRELEEI